jgi:hypothetical protein
MGVIILMGVFVARKIIHDTQRVTSSDLKNSHRIPTDIGCYPHKYLGGGVNPSEKFHRCYPPDILIPVDNRGYLFLLNLPEDVAVCWCEEIICQPDLGKNEIIAGWTSKSYVECLEMTRTI